MLAFTTSKELPLASGSPGEGVFSMLHRLRYSRTRSGDQEGDLGGPVGSFYLSSVGMKRGSKGVEGFEDFLPILGGHFIYGLLYLRGAEGALT